EISLQLIHNKTRIDIKYLKAIEDGNFDVMPQVYLRAFLKEYAKSIDLDPEETLKNYEKAVAGLYGIEESAEQETDKSKKETKQEKKKLVYTSENVRGVEEPSAKKNNNLIIGFAAAGSVIVIAVLLFILTKGEPEIIKENPYEEILEVNTDRFETSQEVTDERVDSISLKITTKDSSWIRLLIDGAGEQEFIMRPNNQKNFKAAREFTLLTGNAGAIELFLNNTKLNFDGQLGSIRNYKINRNGIIRIDNPPVKSK
ncbi:MAG: hypothetical protein A2068_06195, partial [Ignavibacteria bacterium GWB2_35_6b]